MSSELRFRPSSPRYGYFSVSAHGTRPGAQSGPFGVQRTPFWGQTGPNMAESGPKRYSTVFCPSTMATGPPTAPHGGTTARFWHFWAIFGPRISPSARVAKIPVNRRFRPGGVRPKKKLFPRKLRKSLPDSVVTFFFGFGTPSDNHGPFLALLGHFWPQNFSKCPGGQNTSKSPIPAGGGPTEKKVVTEKVAEKPPG